MFFLEHSFPYMSLEPTESRPKNDTIDCWVSNHFVIPLARDQPLSIDVRSNIVTF